MALDQFNKGSYMIYLCVTQKTGTFGTILDNAIGITNVSCSKKKGIIFDIPKNCIHKLLPGKDIFILSSNVFKFDDALTQSKTKWSKTSSSAITVYKFNNDFILLFDTVDQYHIFYKDVISTHFGRVQQNIVSSTYDNHTLNIHNSGELMFSIYGIKALGCKVTFTDKSGNISNIPVFNSDIHSHLFESHNAKYLIDMNLDDGTDIPRFFESNGYILTIKQDCLPGFGIITIENMISEDFIPNVPPKMNEKILVIY
jgi:hypothetical protein